MNINEKLARWRGLENVRPTRLSNGTIVIIYNSNEIVPDYLNDDAAAMSLLDTLVEKGFDVSLEHDNDGWICCYIRDIDKCYIWEDGGYHTTSRAAVVAAVLELIGKEGKMTFENWMTQRYSSEYSKGEYRDHDMQAAFLAGINAISTPYTQGYAKGYSDGVEQQHSQLRLLAEAVLEAHSKHYPQAYHVGCEACRVAREVIGCKPIQ